MPQEEGQPIRLVVSTSLQMGWIESLSFFCAASETGRDVAEDYVETPIGSRPEHKFLRSTWINVARGVLQGIHDVFPAKMRTNWTQLRSRNFLTRRASGFWRRRSLASPFDGDNNTIWLADAKREALLKVLKGWLRISRGSKAEAYHSMSSNQSRQRSDTPSPPSLPGRECHPTVMMS